LTSSTQTEPPKEVEVQTDFPESQVSPLCSPVLEEPPELFQEVRSPEQVPLAFPLFEKSSEIPFVPEKLEEVIVHTIEELDLRFFDEYSDDDSRPASDLSLFPLSDLSSHTEISDHKLLLAKPRAHFPLSNSDIKLLSGQVDQRIPSVDENFLKSKSTPFESTGNLGGDFEVDLQKFSANLQLTKLLRDHQEVFGPLPPPGKGVKLVTMDIELREEWKNTPLRGKCWVMPEKDVLEIDRQVQELIDSGLVEAYPPGTYPKHCTPTFLVDKKESKVRRMVGNYVKLNQRCKPHVAYLPSLEQMVESLARMSVKSKLDLRSGFWQVSLTERARDLTSFVVPSGRFFSLVLYAFWLAKCSWYFSGINGASVQ